MYKLENIPRSLLLLLVASMILLAVSLSQRQPAEINLAEAAAYKEQLRSQVDTTSGEPRSGRDPATQQQTSLSSAASSPSGAGTQIDPPVSDPNSQDASASLVLGDPSQTGLNASGCFYDYGIPGQQCVPAQAANGGVLACSGVHKYFPSGVIVSGTDRFHLDNNLDGTACGSDD
jgi:hypothetical protein